MKKIKQILSKLTFKHYLGIGVGVIAIYFAYSFVAKKGVFSEANGIDLIPRNTAVVAVISVGDIIDKADIDGLFKLDLDIIEDMLDMKDDAIEDLKEESELAASILENPKDIGVDINQDLFFYVIPNKTGLVRCYDCWERTKKDEESCTECDSRYLGDDEIIEAYVCFSGGVDDQDRLMEIIKEVEDQMPNDDSSYESHFDINEGDDYTIAISYNKNTYYKSRRNDDRGTDDDVDITYRNIIAFAWDNDKFLFITNPDARNEKDFGHLKDEVERLFNLESKDKLTSSISFDDFYDNKTDLCLWASAEGLDQDLLEEFVKELDRETEGEIDLDEEDIQECSASLFYNFGYGDISVKAVLYTSDGVKELLQAKTGLETSEFSYEVIMKFDDSGDNTIHVLLKSLLTIADELKLDRLFREFGTYDVKKEEYRDYDR